MTNIIFSKKTKIILIVIGITTVLVGIAIYAAYNKGKKVNEEAHKVVLQKSTDNIQEHEAIKKEILTEPDSAVYKRAMDNYKRSKR